MTDGDENAVAGEERPLDHRPALELEEAEKEVAELDGVAEPLQAGGLVVLGRGGGWVRQCVPPRE